MQAVFKVFPNITRDHFNSLRDQLRNKGAEVPDGDGIPFIDTKHHGVQLNANYNEPNQTLTIGILHEGFLVTDKAVWETLAKYMGVPVPENQHGG